MKFIKLKGRPKKDKKIHMSVSDMEIARALGMIKIPGYLVVMDAEQALKTIVGNKISISEWVMKRLVEMKNDEARV